MIITKRTKTKKVLPFLTKDVLEKLLESVPEVPLETSISDMTIEQFEDIVNDEDKLINSFLKEKLLFDAIGKLKTYRREINEFKEFLKINEIKQSPEEKQAAIGINFPDFVTRMLLTVTKYYNLHSINEAKKMLMSDYFVVLWDEASSLKYQRAYSEIMAKKAELKNKKKK